MVLTSEKTGAGRIRRKRSKGDFKGVRMRKWGRWVSEIRVPQSRSRIWLGSYDTAEKAARAYDAALYCLRGSEGKFNFPDEKRPELPDGSPTSYSKSEIIAVASRFASPSSVSVPSSTSSLTSAASSAEAPILAGETGSACNAVNSHFASGMAEPDMFSSTSYSKTEIEAVASWFESLSSPSVPSSTSSLTSTTSSPEAPILVGETGSTCNAGNSQFASGVVEPDMVSPTSDSKTEIKAVSPWFASLSSLSVLSSASSLTSAASSAEAPILGGEIGSTCDAVNSHFASGMAEPDMFSPTSYSKTEIEAVASWFESLSSPSVPFSTSSLMSTTSSPEEPILAGETGCTCDVGNLHLASGVVEPDMFSPTSDSRTVIEAVSPWFASPSSLSFPFSSSLTSITSSPAAPILVGETGSTCDAGDSNFASGIVELDMFSPENFLLEEPIMLEPNCMWDLLDRN